MGPLGRNTPPDFDHVAAYPLSALAPELRPTHEPVVAGTNWYTSFDAPVRGQDGKYYLPSKNLGTIRGGHCYCLEPAPQPGQAGEELDSPAWWTFYDQKATPACEGFGHARRFSLLFRQSFNAYHLYDDARRIEGTFPNGEGSTNRAACEALKRWGVHAQQATVAFPEAPPLNPTTKAINVFRWATSADEVLAVLGLTSGSTIPLLNSWGTQYPQRVEMPPETLERLLRESGECDVLTDR